MAGSIQLDKDIGKEVDIKVVYKTEPLRNLLTELLVEIDNLKDRVETLENGS